MKLSQSELGTRAGLSAEGAAQRISQYELGIHDPPLELVEKFAQVLDLPTPYFYAKDDQLADWILAFTKTSASKRRVIVDEAGIPSRKSLHANGKRGSDHRPVRRKHCFHSKQSGTSSRRRARRTGRFDRMPQRW